MGVMPEKSARKPGKTSLTARLAWFATAAALVFAGCSGGGAGTDATLWHVDNLSQIGGHEVTVLGNPTVIQTPYGKALEFDGESDAVVLDTNPLAGATVFTVEVIFRPDPGGIQAQRFLHFQAAEEHRVLVETRLNERNEWFLDTFIKSGDSERTLQSRDTWHPLGDWYHAALVYDGGEMRHYVNGIEERAGPVDYLPVSGGQTSIGCRLNRVYWFKGAISTVRVSHRVLAPEEFMRPKTGDVPHVSLFVQDRFRAGLLE